MGMPLPALSAMLPAPAAYTRRESLRCICDPDATPGRTILSKCIPPTRPVIANTEFLMVFVSNKYNDDIESTVTTKQIASVNFFSNIDQYIRHSVADDDVSFPFKLFQIFDHA